MTTLPQNPAMRASRPPGVALPSNAPGQGSIAPGLTGADVMRVLRSNMLLIVFLLIIAAGGGLLVNRYLSNNYSKYTARGYLQVEMSQNSSRVTPVVLNDIAVTIEQRTQVQALKQDSLFQTVLQNPDSPIRQTAWFRSLNMSPRDARADLEKNFGVSPIVDTRLIAVSMTYSNPADTKTIVEAIVEAHLAEQRRLNLDKQYQLTVQLQTRRNTVDADLAQVRRDIAEKKDALTREGLTVDSGMRTSPLDLAVDSATRSLIEIEGNQKAAEAMLGVYTRAMQEKTFPSEVTRAAEQDSEYIELQRYIRGLELQVEDAKRVGPDSPQTRSATARLEGMRAKMESTRTDLYTRYRQQMFERIQQQSGSLDAAIKEARAKVESLKLNQLSVQKLISDYQALDGRERNLQRQLTESQALIESVQSGSSEGAKISWMQNGHPIEPDVPSFPKLSVTMSVAMTLGLALGLLFAFVRELMDQTIRSPRDVMKVGNIALLGTVPHEDDDPQAAGARLPLVIAEAPQSLTAENLRQMRTRLQSMGNLDTTRSIMVTSPNPGEGKTTVAANLAAGLALVGRKILLVDANFKRPELHKLFAVDGKEGFSNALNAPDNLATLAKSTKVPNLSVLPAGPKPTNAAEMLESSLLTDFIDKALESYDHIIFDSGAILFASETVAMAPKVDGVVTVVRARASTRGVLARVKENLRQTKANSLGVVINGIRAYGGGYYNRNMKTYYAYSNNE